MLVGVKAFARRLMVALRCYRSGFPGYDFTTGQVYGVPPLRTSKRMKNGLPE